MFSSTLVERLVDWAPVARLAQLDQHGTAQNLPFVYVRVGHALWSPIDGKPKKRGRLDRLDWIAKHPQVCILIDRYTEDWSQLWWLKLFCRASEARQTHIDWVKAESALAAKYSQYATTQMFSGEPTMIHFEIERWKSWAASGESAVTEWLASCESPKS